MAGGSRGPVFVVGASRSGTELMVWVLNSNPGLDVTGETHYFDDLRVRLGERAGAPLDPDTARWVEDYFLRLTHRPYGQGGEVEHARLDRASLQELASELGGSADAYLEAFCRLNYRISGRRDPALGGFERWGEKTPRHVFRIPDILTAFPGAQVVAMYRDPRAVAASYRDWSSKISVDAEAKRTRESYDPSIVSLLWRATYRAGRAAQERYGHERVRVQRFEDLVGAPEETVRELCDWLGLDHDPAMLEVPMSNSTVETFGSSIGMSTAPVDRWRERLADHEVATVQLWARREMASLDYPREPRASGLRGVLSAVVRLPLAVARAAWANRHRMGRVPSYVLSRARLITSR